MKCPRCQSELREVSRHGITLDTCDTCHGVWLDKNEAEGLIARRLNDGPSTQEVARRLAGLLSHAAEDPRGTPLTCPRCGQLMRPTQYTQGTSRVTGDLCAACGGTWLDAGELGALFVFASEPHPGPSILRDIAFLAIAFGLVVAAGLMLFRFLAR
ncbi:MAG: zf-TFIIB domain-containing protein [Deltaproteobacteria bacterium]|nr:zf-TFIIB domain-containing protein [Deltaproteobacteria bacterium]